MRPSASNASQPSRKYLEDPTRGRFELGGNSDAILRVKELIQKLAACDATALICGETGTGKEVAARAIHRSSHRAAAPMICVNCSAIPDALAENELFGSEKGAFTGASHRQDGQIQQADGGTLLLDEIGDMPLLAQAKILRAVEGKEVQRLGGSKTEPVDVRILAATHRDLNQLIAERQFRSDLFYRLNVFTLEMPPLRDRKEDIPVLVEGFIREFNSSHSKEVEGATTAAMRALMEHDWPGNIRELRNVIERAFVVARTTAITTDDLYWYHQKSASSPELSVLNLNRSYSLPTVPVHSEPDQLLSALHVTHWNKSEAAKLLQWSRMTIYRKIAKYNLPTRKPATPTDSVRSQTRDPRAASASAGE